MTRRQPYHWIRPPGPLAPGMKIGLLGGSFNPAHEGHLHISLMAKKRLGLDYVWWLVAPQNPLKPTFGMAPLAHRLGFARGLAATDPRLLVMDIERNLGTRYTIDTLTKLKHRFGTVDFVWLMGSDSLESFHRWKRWRDIARLVPIAVIARPGSVLAGVNSRAAAWLSTARVRDPRRLVHAAPPAITLIDGPRNPLSSTEIRRRCGQAELFVRVIPA